MGKETLIIENKSILFMIEVLSKRLGMDPVSLGEAMLTKAINEAKAAHTAYHKGLAFVTTAILFNKSEFAVYRDEVFTKKKKISLIKILDTNLRMDIDIVRHLGFIEGGGIRTYEVTLHDTDQIFKVIFLVTYEEGKLTTVSYSTRSLLPTAQHDVYNKIFTIENEDDLQAAQMEISAHMDTLNLLVV